MEDTNELLAVLITSIGSVVVSLFTLIRGIKESRDRRTKDLLEYELSTDKSREDADQAMWNRLTKELNESYKRVDVVERRSDTLWTALAKSRDLCGEQMSQIQTLQLQLAEERALREGVEEQVALLLEELEECRSRADD